MKENLHKFLSSVPRIDPAAEHEVDLLRLILQGKAGTANQRACLIRIIKQNRLGSKNFPNRLAQKLGFVELQQSAQNKISYVIPAPTAKVLASKKKHNAYEALLSQNRAANNERRNRLGIPADAYTRILQNYPAVHLFTEDQLANEYREILEQQEQERERQQREIINRDNARREAAATPEPRRFFQTFQGQTIRNFQDLATAGGPAGVTITGRPGTRLRGARLRRQLRRDERRRQQAGNPAPARAGMTLDGLRHVRDAMDDGANIQNARRATDAMDDAIIAALTAPTGNGEAAREPNF